MLRYLRRAEDLTTGHLRWGILTNGRLWRLYHLGSRNPQDDYFELDLPALLGIEPYADDLFAAPVEERPHWLKVFALMFATGAFVPGLDGRTFHQVSRDQGRYFEERVADDLSKVIFGSVFPQLAMAIRAGDPDHPEITDRAYLAQIKTASLVLLYRLLFILYAEDRDLLPIRDDRYDDYGLRLKVRNDVARRLDANDVLSETGRAYWNHTKDLFRLIALGDASIGLPPYNGGLFDDSQAPLLGRVHLPDKAFANVIDGLGRVERDGRRHYVNYRDLSVRQLGSVYERLLEYDLVEEDGELLVRLNPFARKGSGSYYTPDDLVRLIVERTIGPLVEERLSTFMTRAEQLAHDTRPKSERLERLAEVDPAIEVLRLKVCDPAMGSGHFLVDVVDYLANKASEAAEAAREAVEWGEYQSPVRDRIEAIRDNILDQATRGGWVVRDDQLEDAQIIRRMILKRVIHGVDKNPMAVELAKVSLWLHTFTVGAPLSFLDHHLRCGDSLFGETVRSVMDRLSEKGALFINSAVARAKTTAAGMDKIERLTDADIAEVHESASIFDTIAEATRPLSAFMDLMHAFRWLDRGEKADRAAIDAYLFEQFGDPLKIATGEIPVEQPTDGNAGLFAEQERFPALLKDARDLIAEERFLHWEVAFPGIWNDWESTEPRGGFDAVVGNPPWDRIKFQEVEWFAARKPEIAHAGTAATRKRMVADLKAASDPLAIDYDKAVGRAEAASRVARGSGVYPLLSGGDTNLYSLFVERALSLVKPDGIAGLLVPSGIASDKTASTFFKSVAGSSRLSTLFDFENKKVFFPDIHASFKFCTFVASGAERTFPATQCGFYLHSLAEIKDSERAFELTAADFLRVNPNTGTAPIFRTRRDAEITTTVYESTSILVDRTGSAPKSIWPVRYFTMFHMTNDSNLFVTRADLEEQGAYPVGANDWKRGDDEFIPIYEGKMIQAYDHRAASVEVDTSRLHRPSQPVSATEEQHADPDWLPEPQFWTETPNVHESPFPWFLGFKDVTAPTNMRSMIAAAIPYSGVGNTFPVLLAERGHEEEFKRLATSMLANLNSVPFDFVARQKIQGQHLNWYIVEQLPVLAQADFENTFGGRTAGEIVREEVLALTYTANDMAPFAHDMDYDGPPFAWDELDRLRRRAKLDALFFLLYGITNRDDVRYIYSTFPIVEREETAAHGRYLSRDYCLAYMNALDAGDPDAEIRLP